MARTSAFVLALALLTAPAAYAYSGPASGDNRTVISRSAETAEADTETPRATGASTRLISSPDFLNADVGDLAEGPSYWYPGRSANGTNRAYRKALNTILDDWRSQDPAAVLVAGDLVNGRWGFDDQRTGNFGPVSTHQQRLQAVRRAADTYYPQWRQRFHQRKLNVYPAMGDHEYGDDPWPRGKRALTAGFEDAFADHFGRTRTGSPRYRDRPKGKHKFTAYAVRPTPDVQVVTINVFDFTRSGTRIAVDQPQMRWLQGVLAQAQRDGIWTVVQGHTPILWPVRTKGSSKLHYPGGSSSALWRLFEMYGVDLYLAGEVHAPSLRTSGGVTQITHGGLFQFGLTNYLTLDFFDDEVRLGLRDYNMVSNKSRDARLWETRREGMPARLRIRGGPRTIGTATITRSSGLADTSGILDPLK